MPRCEKLRCTVLSLLISVFWISMTERASGDWPTYRGDAPRSGVTSEGVKLPLAERWSIAEGLVARAEDEDDHNLPLMYWYGIEPLVAADSERALDLAFSAPVVSLTDSKGKQYLVPTAAIGYVEIGSDSGRRVGFVG